MSNKIKQWQDKIEAVSGSQTFCVLPWIHFATRPNGDMRLCCSANASGAGENHTVGLVKNEKGQPANFGRETPMSAWNNEYMKDVRLTMLEGKIPASCSKCIAEESRGVASKRIWETGSWMEDGIDVEELIKQTAEDGTIPERLVYLDLRLGHTCNLKCVMCSPHDSSQWVADHKKIYPLFQAKELKEQMSWDRKDFNNKWHENPDFWKEMYAQIPNLKQVEIIELWKQFKKVKVGFSIDAVGDRNWYIRYPSDWDVIERNLHKLDNTPDNIQVSIATAIQILNIKHLADFAKWKITQNFKKVNLENTVGGIQAGGGIVNMHLLYIPTFLSIRLLPAEDKAEVRRNFAELANWLHENYRQDEDFWKNNPYGWKRWQAVLDFMDAEDHTNQISAFNEYISRLDKLRGTRFKLIFPELSHLESYNA